MSTRGLNDHFIAALRSGCLNPFLVEIQKDKSLDLEVRDNYINIYYRGGNLFKISQSQLNIRMFTAVFTNSGYFIDEYKAEYYEMMREIRNLNPLEITDRNEACAYCALIPGIKKAMDYYLLFRPQPEQEFQQQIICANNLIKNRSDIKIIDKEYTNTHYGNLRFDLIGIYPAQGGKYKISIMELKWNADAFNNMEKHLEDAGRFISDKKNINAFKVEMINIIRNKIALKLFPESYKFIDVDLTGDMEVEYMLVLAGCINRNSLSRLYRCFGWRELKFIILSLNTFLYSDRILNKEQFKEFVDKTEPYYENNFAGDFMPEEDL